MFKVALVGHSLLPSTIPTVPDVEIRIFRKPGGTWLDDQCREFAPLWNLQFDLVILVLGGNDLAFTDYWIV